MVYHDGLSMTVIDGWSSDYDTAAKWLSVKLTELTAVY